MTGMTTPPPSGLEWRSHIITSAAGIRDLLGRIRRIAVLGIKTEVGRQFRVDEDDAPPLRRRGVFS